MAEEEGRRNAAQEEAVETQSMRRNMGSLLDKGGSLSDSQKKNRSLVLQHKKWNYTNSLSKVGSRFFLRASGKEHSPIDTLILAPQDLCHTSDL